MTGNESQCVLVTWLFHVDMTFSNYRSREEFYSCRQIDLIQGSENYGQVTNNDGQINEGMTCQ